MCGGKTQNFRNRNIEELTIIIIIMTTILFSTGIFLPLLCSTIYNNCHNSKYGKKERRDTAQKAS